MHVGSVRQTATIVEMSSDCLRTGDKALVRFRFIKSPEYLKTGLRMVFREGRTKAVGTVTKLFPHVSATAQNTRQQRASKKALEQNHHHARPQNEPQKASKKNRKSRAAHAAAAAAAAALQSSDREQRVTAVTPAVTTVEA